VRVGSRFPSRAAESGWVGSNNAAPTYLCTCLGMKVLYRQANMCTYTSTHIPTLGTCAHNPCSPQSLQAHPRGQLGPPGPLCFLALPAPAFTLLLSLSNSCAPFLPCLSCRFRFPPLNTRPLPLVSPLPPLVSPHFQFFNLLFIGAPYIHSLPCTASEHRHHIISDDFHLFSYTPTGLDWTGLD
jgi:hypothetical protein